MSPKYILPDTGENPDIATVDDIDLRKGWLDPVELTDDQARRLEEAGVELEEAGSKAEAAGQLTGNALDNELRREGLPLTGTADEKRQRLEDHLESEDDDGGDQ